MTESPKPESKWGWRILRWFLIVLAVLATLIAVFITEEDWRGKRAWENYRREMQGNGETFDWHAFAPPAVSDDLNLFNAPNFKRLIDGYWPNTDIAHRLSLSIYGDDASVAWPTNGNWVKGTTTDLASWQQYYRALAVKTNEFPVAPQTQTPAPDVLLALSKYNSAIDQLREAARRPDSRLPLDYDQGIGVTSGELLPYLVFLKRSAQLLQLRSIAELQNGESEMALEDIKLMLRLNDSIRNEPFLIAHLVRIAVVSIAMQPIWEGLAQHRWTDNQLAMLEDALAKMDFLQDYEFTMRGEAAFAIEIIDNQRVTREFKVLDPDTSEIATQRFYLTPDAYFYQSELAYAKMSQIWAMPLVDTNRHIVSPAILHRTQAEIDALTNHVSSYNAVALMPADAAIPSARKFATAQTDVDLARVTCALERYRLAHGQYPERLDALVPQFIESLPHDIINGQPLHYRPAPDGKFLLYSVGWNETDDGGKAAFTKNGNVDYLNGDWVWPNGSRN
jgi:tetratricopeptide (TPR) repeat protein